MTDKTVFLFPGQGSQSLEMLSAFAQNQIVQQVFSDASEVLDYDLWQLTQEGPIESLNATENTQPALLAASVALWRVWLNAGGAKPDFMAGHSLGEYSALVCADSLDLTDAIKLVATRGKLMQQACPEGKGAMAAIIGLDNAKVSEVCQQAANGDVVSPANFNSPGQVVISGDKTAVARAVELAKDAGAKLAKMLDVSVPSHCDLMRGAADELAEQLAAINIQIPELPVIHNVNVQSSNTPDAIRNALVEQLYSPVKWVDTIEWLITQGVTCAYECGPGKVLAGLNKRISKTLENRRID